MPAAETAVFRKWARRSLFALAILAAPAAYSEVASTITDSDDSGTLLGNYLSGRVARGDHDTAAAADFYSRALAEDPNNELILEQAFLLETAAAEEIKAYCEGRIARFKIPRYIRFVDSFPMTASGKVQKFKLREIHMSEGLG